VSGISSLNIIKLFGHSAVKVTTIRELNKMNATLEIDGLGDTACSFVFIVNYAYESGAGVAQSV
jgi:hypothetical protein